MLGGPAGGGRRRGEKTQVIRPVERDDADAWAAMRARLWADADAGELAEEVRAYLDGRGMPTLETNFIAVDESARPVGFLELALRAYADGCASMPVPYVEAWFVELHQRGRGLGRRLMHAAEIWARAHGYTEIASDAELTNAGSLHAHMRCGFEEIERQVKFRKPLATS